MNMRYISLGSVVPARSRVIVEAWVPDGETFTVLEESEMHFEFRGLEEAIANYIAREAGSNPITHMRFSVQGVDASDRTVLGTWTRGGES